MIFFGNFILDNLFNMTFYNDNVSEAQSPIHHNTNTKGDKGKSYDDSKSKVVHPYLKKGQGKLASSNHGITEFAKKRKENIYASQEKLERNPSYINDPIGYKYGFKS
jgi:hypothetical protein